MIAKLKLITRDIPMLIKRFTKHCTQLHLLAVDYRPATTNATKHPSTHHYQTLQHICPAARRLLSSQPHPTHDNTHTIVILPSYRGFFPTSVSNHSTSTRYYSLTHSVNRPECERPADSLCGYVLKLLFKTVFNLVHHVGTRPPRDSA